jgi:hypothetical protein
MSFLWHGLSRMQARKLISQQQQAKKVPASGRLCVSAAMIRRSHTHLCYSYIRDLPLRRKEYSPGGEEENVNPAQLEGLQLTPFSSLLSRLQSPRRLISRFLPASLHVSISVPWDGETPRLIQSADSRSFCSPLLTFILSTSTTLDDIHQQNPLHCSPHT